MQVKQHLEHRFPDIEVIGSNYPPEAKKVAIAQIVQVGMLSTIGLTLTGAQLFAGLGMEPPSFYHSMANNKMTTCMTVWFLGNTVAQNMLSTGAFEVYYDGNLVFSKLKTGRLPQIPSILSAVEAEVEQAGRLDPTPRTQQLPNKTPGSGKKLHADTQFDEEDDFF